MSVAVCTLGCDRKILEGFPSWETLFHLQGDYTLYFNYQRDNLDEVKLEYMDLFSWFQEKAQESKLQFSLDEWVWNTSVGFNWRAQPKFDQDQARLAPIVCARNMCVEYAIQTKASHLLFIDADIIPPLDIIPRLLEVGRDAVGGLVFGRGIHKDCPYLFGEKKRWKTDQGYELAEVEHGNIGFFMLSRKLFEAVRFRYGETYYPDGYHHLTSDDPAYHADCYRLFNEWPVVRLDVMGKHEGDLKESDVSQF